jgi:hypothetical protein
MAVTARKTIDGKYYPPAHPNLFNINRMIKLNIASSKNSEAFFQPKYITLVPT